MSKNIISFADKKAEIERRIEMSLTDEELNMDYFHEQLRRLEDKLNRAFLTLWISVLLTSTTILVIDFKNPNCSIVNRCVLLACILWLSISGTVKKYLIEKLCTLEGIRNQFR